MSECTQLLNDHMLSLLQVFGYLFSDDADVVHLVSKVMPLVASFQVRSFSYTPYNQ